MKVIVIVPMLIPILVTTYTSVTAMNNFEIATVNSEKSFVLALYTVIMDFYVPQSNTIFITRSSTKQDSKQMAILESILARLDRKPTVTWTINDHRYVSNSMERINNIIIVDSYESWR